MSLTWMNALNPMSRESGITYQATGHTYTQTSHSQELPDLTVDLIVPMLWHARLGIWDSIVESFFVIHGNHFDYSGKGYGQKGVLDFAFSVPLAARKLIADTYLDERTDTYLQNALAWLIGYPIRAISFLVALSITIILSPIIALIAWWRGTQPPPPPPPGGAGALVAAAVAEPVMDGEDTPVISDENGAIATGSGLHQLVFGLPIHSRLAALSESVTQLAFHGLATDNNIRRLVSDRHGYVIAYRLRQVRELDQAALDELFQELNVLTIEALEDAAMHAPLRRDYPRTPAGVTSRIPLVVRGALREHILTHNDVTINQLEQGISDELWAAIKPNVERVLQEDLDAVYPNAPGIHAAVIEAGQDIQVPQDIIDLVRVRTNQRLESQQEQLLENSPRLLLRMG